MTPDRSSSDLISFFEAARQAYTRAAAEAGLLERDFQVNRFIVRLSFASQPLARLLTPALEHLALPDGAQRRPDLSVSIWDGQSTQSPMPPCPWEWDQAIARGEIPGFSSEQIQVAAYADAGLLNIIDLQQSRALYWIQDPARLPYHEQGAPLRNILHWFLRARGLYLLHAGAVSLSGQGALLVGKGGSGKSTAALSCLSQGWDYLSDDYCLLDLSQGVACDSLFNSAKLDGEHIRRFPHLLSYIQNPERLHSEKALLFLHRHFPSRITSRLPVKAILLPHISGLEETTLRPASAMAALRALAPSSIFQLPMAGQAEFQAIVRLVQQVPCYQLEMGTQITAIPNAIAATLQRNP